MKLRHRVTRERNDHDAERATGVAKGHVAVNTVFPRAHASRLVHTALLSTVSDAPDDTGLLHRQAFRE